MKRRRSRRFIKISPLRVPCPVRSKQKRRPLWLHPSVRTVKNPGERRTPGEKPKAYWYNAFRYDERGLYLGTFP